ncbi:hypothetical protein [Haloparvum sp. AD34]
MSVPDGGNATGEEESGMDDEVSAMEVVADSRPDEARRVLEVVARYVNDGGSLSDVVVVAPDLDAYEAPLADAAARHDLPTATWTQLPLTDTLPYRLLTALCRVLDDDPCTADEFLAPLEYEWAPPDADAGPLDAAATAALRAGILDETDPETDRPVTEWCDRVAGLDAPAVVDAYRSWVGTHRHAGEPSSQQVVETLEPVLDEYEETVLPRRKDRDDPTLTRTARTARAVVRTQDLVVEVAEKYDDRVAAGENRSWTLVDRLAETIGGLRAGRREHANARALDVVDANDTWALSREVVIAVGLRQGGWIESPGGLLPPELRDRLLGGRPDASSLGLRATWSEARVRDHFRDTVAAAMDTIVCTRPRRDEDGTEVPRSPLLATVDTRLVEPPEVFADD